jgi:methyl-accepting chemotaxis protein
MIYVPLWIRLGQLFLLERSVAEICSRFGAPGANDEAEHERLREAMLDSPVGDAFSEFERRWRTAQLGELRDRAPVRLMDVFDDRPLLPLGVRSSLLPVLPGLFLGLGVFAALLALIPSLGQVGPDGAQQAWLASQLGVALRTTAWGFLCAFFASLAGRTIEGGFLSRATRLDELVELAFGSVSPGELAELTRQTQQRSLETLGKELSQFANELNERMDRGLQRIEQSTARSANLVSQEQRGALHTVVQELSLSVRQGVEHHLAELRTALQRAVEHQTSVTSGLADTFERMNENAQTQDRVARSLSDSAHSVEEAARVMRESSGEMQPVLEHLGRTSRSLSETADRIGDTQDIIARTSDGVRGALEHAARGVDDQRAFIELSLGEIRRAMAELGDGLGDSLQHSLRSVDDVLGGAVIQLRDALAESNETIDRLSAPIRAAEGTTRETHVALDRVRSEVEALGEWMSQAVKPLRSGLVEVEGRAEDISRAIVEFTNHTRQMDKTMQALREEVREESRRLQGTGSELGRQLQAASDAMGMFETGGADAARRVRSGGTAERERSGSRTPDALPKEGSGETPSGKSTSPTSDPRDPAVADSGAATIPERGASAPSEPTASPARDVATTASFSRSETPPAPPSLESPAADSTTHERQASELSGPPYRMGTPRAQGPDPYARFDDAPTASNVRHLPTRERELGDELKLSELLGPSPGKGADDDPDPPTDGAADRRREETD